MLQFQEDHLSLLTFSPYSSGITEKIHFTGIHIEMCFPIGFTLAEGLPLWQNLPSNGRRAELWRR